MQQRILTFLLLLIGSQLQAQTASWSLEKCINYALKNNLQVQQTELSEQQADINKQQAWWAQFPTLNANFRQGVNFGNQFNQVTFERVVGVTTNQQYGINLNQTIFQGFQIRNTLKQSKVDLEAAQKDTEQAKNDVALQVAQFYLSVLLAEESKEVLVEQAKVTKAQYDQTLKLIDAGVVAENSKYDLEAQMARDEENIVNAENSIALAYTNLKLAMNLDVSEEIVIEKVGNLEVSGAEELATLDEVYQDATNSQPNILAAKLREKSAELGLKIAKGAFFPTLSFFGGIGTNYNSALTLPTRTKTVDGVISTGTVDLTGEAVTVQGDPTEVPDPESAAPLAYFDQLAASFSGNVGVSLSIPIFNQNRVRLGTQRAKLGIKIAQLATQQLETTLKSNIQRALTDVKAAAKRLKASEKSVIATRMSVQNTRKRYELGVVNSFELTSVQNTLIASESNLLQAKYDYRFKLAILDYYRGRPIKVQ